MLTRFAAVLAQDIFLDHIARNVHIVMLVMCLGLAALADLTAAKSISRPLSDRSLARLHRYHSALSTGLILLWISGIAIIWLKTSFDVSQFSPKLMAKIAVVTLLSFNALVIGRVALGTFETYRDSSLGELRFRLRLCLQQQQRQQRQQFQQCYLSLPGAP